jgi:hypothetical protein
VFENLKWISGTDEAGGRQFIAVPASTEGVSRGFIV